MQIIADTHVHIYAHYQRARLLDAAAAAFAGHEDRLGSLADTRLLFLTETQRDDVWGDWLAGAPPASGSEWTFAAAPEQGAGLLTHPHHGVLTVLAGRQIVTTERLEVLALTCTERIPDGRPVREVIAAVRATGAIATLSWSPGKWWGRRGRLVAELLTEYEPGQVVIGDVLLRPGCWPEPLLMRTARRRGFMVLAGSDPLPLPNEEQWAGAYGIEARINYDPSHPVTSIRRWLSQVNSQPNVVGARNNTTTFVHRIWAMHRRKHA